MLPTHAERDALDRFVGPDVQRVLDALPPAVLLVESSSLVSGSNALAAQLFGVSSADLAGRCIFDLMAAAGAGLEPSRPADLRSTLSAVMRGRTLVETVELHQTNGAVSAAAHFAPWFDDTGDVIGAVVSLLSDQLALAFASEEIGTWSVDLATGIVRGDVTFAGLVGLDPVSPEYTLDQWLGMLHPDDVGSTLARGGDTNEVLVRRRAPSHRRRWVGAVGGGAGNRHAGRRRQGHGHQWFYG